jgi:lipoprotein-anchoring transpeptidase ErfK/SrfK
MNMKYIEARENVIKAREALRSGDKESARQLGEQAALLAPEMVDVWLVLTASDSNSQNALAYAQKALQINPQSARAHHAVEWAARRMKQVEALDDQVLAEKKIRSDAIVPNPPKRVYREAIASPVLRDNGRNWVLPSLLIGAACFLFSLASLFVLTRPALSSRISDFSVPASQQEKHWASVEIPKSTVTAIDVNAFAAQSADTPVAQDKEATTVPTRPAPKPGPKPTDEPTLSPTDLPTSIPTETPISIPAVTETPGIMAMEIIADTPTSEYIAPVAAAGGPYPDKGNGARWIDVNLSEQRVYAYEGDIVVNSFIVSTGTARTPTVTGKYKIWIKLKSTTMSGPGYYLTNVPYTMYFYKGYGLHGTYWHNNFGTPMSHGCVNLSIPDAQWLYNWAFEGTTVNVHY